VDSPFHNDQKKVTELYEYIFQTMPDFEEDALTKEVVWQKLYGKEVFKDSRLRRVMSDLLRVCEEFLDWEMYKNTPQQVQINRLRYYRTHHLDKFFKATLQDIRMYEQQHPQQDIWHYFYQLGISHEITNQISQQRKRTEEPNLQEVSNHLDAFYLINKLKCCCSIFNYQNLAVANYEVPMIKEVLMHLEEQDYSHIPLIVIYHKCLLTLLEPEKTVHFQELKTTLFEHQSLFSQEEARDIFVLARNYCIKQANQGKQEYLKELLDLYEVELANGILLDHGFLSPFTYKNIVTLGIKLKRYEWTQVFIEEYKTFLSEEFRESTYAFNLARLYFDKEDWAKVIPLLNQMEYKEIFLELSARNLLMKTYYEMEEFEVLISFLDSFQMFLRRKKKILGYHCTGYMNLIKVTRQLVRLEYGKKEEREKFKQKVVEMKEIVDKQWVLNKL